MIPRVFLDACVLYPNVLREIVLGAATRGLLVPLWSPRVLDEWTHAAARLGPGAAVVAQGEIAVLRLRWAAAEVPAAAVASAARSFDASLPDANDAHVLAAAIAGAAEIILTLNLRDFPARALAAHGLCARHPDALLLSLWQVSPAPVADVAHAVRQEAARLSGRDQPLRPLLRRAGLPRLAKALDQP